MNVSSTASDVYSYAIVIQEIFSIQEPYDEHADFSTPIDVINAVIKNGLQPEPSTDTPITFRQIMEIAWSDNVLSRPTFDQICKMIQYAHPLRKSVLDSIIDTMEKYTQRLEEKIKDQTVQLRTANRKSQDLDNYIRKGTISLEDTNSCKKVGIVEANFCIPLSQRVERDSLLYINSLQSKIYELTRAYDVTFESMVGSKTLLRVIFCREKKIYCILH